MTERFVYFAERDGFIKIGCSTNLTTRARDLRARMIASVPGDFALERYFHHLFAGSAIGGEWFHPTLDLLTFVCALPGLPPVVPDLEAPAVAAMFSVSPHAVRSWAAKGLLPASRSGRHWWFKEAEIVQWIDDHTHGVRVA